MSHAVNPARKNAVSDLISITDCDNIRHRHITDDHTPEVTRMAIFSRWGEEIEILAYCGKHTPEGCKYPMTMVKGRPKGEEREQYYFAYTLRADGGLTEIETAVDAAPTTDMKRLPKGDLKAAIHQAS
jgi:hypothetical protein